MTGKPFVDRTGTRHLPYTTAFEQLQRLAGVAGIPDTATITPHSLRHTFATLCLEANVPIQDVQDALRHSDPRTTRLYDKSNLAHARHPTYRLAAALAD